MENEVVPEMRLVWATLNQAADDACIPAHARGDRRNARADAWRWIESESDAPFSFRWCLDMVGMDNAIERIRRDLANDPFDVASRLKRRSRHTRERQPWQEWPELGMRAHRS